MIEKQGKFNFVASVYDMTIEKSTWINISSVKKVSLFHGLFWLVYTNVEVIINMSGSEYQKYLITDIFLTKQGQTIFYKYVHNGQWFVEPISQSPTL